MFEFNGGAFVDISDRCRITKSTPNTTFGAASVDVDRDGDTDLFVARDSGVHLYINEGGVFTGSLVDIDFGKKSTPLSFALADLNGDGAVDMYVSTYLPKDQMEGQNIFNKEGYGSNSLLLLNNGDNTFKDITREAGLHYTHNTFQGVFVDMDADGRQDLVVAHDTGQVKTWKNMGDLKFKDMPNPMSDRYGYPMGIAVGDYNNDGRVDFFFSNTGGTPPRFIVTGDLREDQVFEGQLLLFRNDGDFKFTNVAAETKTAEFEFSWGVLFHDFNLDGLQDLVISQNYIGFPPHKLFRLPGRFLVQKSDHTFVATEDRSGVVNREYELVSLVSDFNCDGYPDMVKVNISGTPRAYLNKGGENHYLTVRLPNNPESLGAQVRVHTAAGKRLTDFVVVGEGVASDQTRTLTFGLGAETAVEKVEVLFPSGKTKTISSPRVDALLEVDNAE